MFHTNLPVGFSNATSNSKARQSSTQPLELQTPNSPSLKHFADDTIELKANHDTVALAHTLPLSHTPHFGGDDWDWYLYTVDPNKLEKAKALIEAGADINAKIQYKSGPDFNKTLTGSALNNAAKYNNIELLKILLEKGAFPNIKGVEAESETGNRPLHTAAHNGHPKAVKLLLDYGADPNAAGFWRRAPLHNAISSPEITQYLLDAGADPDFTDTGNNKPEDYSTSNEVLEMLSKARKKKREAAEKLPKENAELKSQNAVLQSTLAQTQEAAQKEATGLNQQLAETRTLKTQRSAELRGQVEAEKVLARKRSTELKGLVETEKALKTKRSVELSAQISEVKEEAQKREHQLKQHYEKQLADAAESRNDINEDKKELKRLYTDRLKDLQNSSKAKIDSLEIQLAESRTLKSKRSGELRAQISEVKEQAQKREHQLRQDFETQKTDFVEMARGRYENQKEENEKLRRDKSALRQDLEGKLRDKDTQLESTRDRSRERNALLAGFKSDKTHLQEWLLETKKALGAKEAKLEKVEKAFFAKSTQAAIQRVRAEGSRSGRSQTIMISEDDPEVRAISPDRRSSSSLQDQAEARSERSSQSNDAGTTRSELSDISRNSVELDSQPRSSSPVYELSAEPLPLDCLPRPLQERFELGLQEREREYQDSISSRASSASRSQSSQAKSTTSQSSAKSGTSVTSWISDGVKSVNSVFSQRDDKSSSDEGSVLDKPLKGRKGLVFKKTATRRIVEDPYPSRKLRSNASTTSLRSKNSDASDQEYFALRKPEELASMYQEGKLERNFELFEAIYNNKKQDIERILKENPRARKQKDKEGRNAVHWAALLGQKDTIDAILKPLNADTRHNLLNRPDAKGSTPIHYAAEQNQVDAADILANTYHADLSLTSNSVMSYKQNVFHIATDKGRSKLLQKLLPNAPIGALNKPDVHERTPLMYAAMRGQPKLIRALLKKKGIDTLAEDANHKDAFYHAVEHGVDNKNWKPVRKFLIAKRRGHVKVAFDAHHPELEYSSFGLLAAHAPKRVVRTALKFKHFNPNQSIFKKSWSSAYKYFTPFSLAAKEGHVDGMEALAEDDRVKPRALSERQARSAYHIALEHNQPEAEKFLRTSPLIKRPIKLNKRDAKGRSPKRVGTRAGAAEAVESHLENSPGERKSFRFRKRDIEVGKMKRSDKATALDKLAATGKRMRLR